jgi:hypothetical protein
LFEEDSFLRKKENQLSVCLDTIRGRFGHGAVQWGRTLAAA